MIKEVKIEVTEQCKRWCTHCSSDAKDKKFQYLNKSLVKRIIHEAVLLKASSGGGGKGIRQVNSFDELETNYNIVKQEAKNAFNDSEIYIEKFIQNPRHVELQILADEHGNIVHLG